MTKEIRVQIWKGKTNVDNAPSTEPIETVTLQLSEPYVWQDDPYYSSIPLGFHIHPDDRPATLNIYTNDSVRSPPKSDVSEWNGPVERGLRFTNEDERAFGCELWGRVLFVATREK